MRRPSVTNPAKPADFYSNKQCERVIEFHDSETDKGGLIKFRRIGGELYVTVYRTDPGIIVQHHPDPA